MPADGPEYAAPALDKALDVLELLADREIGMTQSELAGALGRSSSQLFRVLQRLERRGWIERDRPSGVYGLSMAMFDLAHRHPPLRGLIAVARGPMRDVADSVMQSCNLSVLDGDRVRVVAQIESPSDFGFQVRVGATFPLDTPAGAVLTGRAATAAGQEVLTSVDTLHPAITDVVVGIRDRFGDVRAAITVPYISTSFSTIGVADVVARLTHTGDLITARLQGSTDTPTR